MGVTLEEFTLEEVRGTVHRTELRNKGYIRVPQISLLVMATQDMGLQKPHAYSGELSTQDLPVGVLC